jgi:hypothetical protein
MRIRHQEKPRLLPTRMKTSTHCLGSSFESAVNYLLRLRTFYLVTRYHVNQKVEVIGFRQCLRYVLFRDGTTFVCVCDEKCTACDLLDKYWRYSQ